MSLERAKRAAVAAAAVLAFIAFLGDAHAGFNVKNFSCSTTPFGVNVDVSGLGNTDICVISTVDTSMNCACAGGGGNCSSDAKKNTSSTSSTSSTDLQPQNGRVRATVPVPSSATDDSQCAAALACPSGQTAKLVSDTSSADFQLCTSNGASPCSCGQQLAEPITCGPTSATPFPGKHGSCAALFP